jgi:hypothetical protein
MKTTTAHPPTQTEPRIAKGWLVCHDHGWCSIQDAPTAGKAKWGDYREFWQDSVYDFFAGGLSCRRRNDLDGLTMTEAEDVIWPCICHDEERTEPCPKHEWC